ncbi:hypothetical protein MJH12_06055 [bacterium]|nr:hypothetical protein [bacterium]
MDNSNVPDNEIDQTTLDNVYEDFVQSVLDEGSSIVINYIKNDCSGMSDEQFVISKQIIPRLSKIIECWNSDFLSLIERLMRTIQVQITADGNMVAPNESYDIRVFFVDKIVYEPQGATRFRLVLIESKGFSYFNHEVIQEPDLEQIEDILEQDEVSSLVAKLLEGDVNRIKGHLDINPEPMPSLSNDVRSDEDPFKNIEKQDLLDVKVQECRLLRSKIRDLEAQLSRQDEIYQKMFNRMEKSYLEDESND